LQEYENGEKCFQLTL